MLFYIFPLKISKCWNIHRKKVAGYIAGSVHKGGLGHYHGPHEGNFPKDSFPKKIMTKGLQWILQSL